MIVIVFFFHYVRPHLHTDTSHVRQRTRPQRGTSAPRAERKAASLSSWMRCNCQPELVDELLLWLLLSLLSSVESWPHNNSRAHKFAIAEAMRRG